MVEQDIITEVIDTIYIYRSYQFCIGIEWFKRLLDTISCIHKVEHIRILLVRMRTVQATQCLHCLYHLQLLVHKHGMEQRLVESSLILICHHEHIIHVAGEIEWQFLFTDIDTCLLVEFGLSEFFFAILHLSRESHQGLNICKTLLLAILLNLQIIS